MRSSLLLLSSLWLALACACGAAEPTKGPPLQAPAVEEPPAVQAQPPLIVTVRCKVDGCPLDEDDVFIDITLTNRAVAPIELPVDFLRQSGPVMRLIDARTGADIYLRRPPANLELRSRTAPLAPGEAVTLAWVISTSELAQFGRPIDVTAEITIATDIVAGGQTSAFTGTATLRFTGA